MYHNPGIGTGIGAGAAGAGGLAATGFEALWVSAAAIGLLVAGFVLLRTSRLRRAAAARSTS
ncbi:peptidase [Promicromonospora panici]|uniref:peptidase n=1 Tax=Promicromonospora panici TaxID=2219658 RepID=UPI00101D4E47|nr:peptidase [Promicromonospora panici]